MKLVLAGLLALMALPLACTKDRDAGPLPCESWKYDIQPLVKERCVPCHGGREPAGRYDLRTYAGALGTGTDDTPNLVAGDPASLFVAVLADGTHNLGELKPTFTHWVETCQLAYTTGDIHAPGLLNPASTDFHSVLLREKDWNFDFCSECHGADFGGGGSAASCLTCHEAGPTDCATCHRGPISTGAHQAHLNLGSLQHQINCENCHQVPQKWDDRGHIVNDGVRDDAPAEVIFSGLAIWEGAPPTRTEPARYDSSSKTCSAVYCHAGTVEPDHTLPRWEQLGPLACDGCHGNPPADHESDRCFHCHAPVVDRDNQLARLELHLDGALDLGGADGNCRLCHGDASNVAPPFDLEGDTSPLKLSVGAHRIHLVSPRRLATPVACNECHVVPESVADIGHVDTALPAEVFAPGSGDLARRDGAEPRWDHETGTCSDVYCHGGGDALGVDQSPDVLRTLIWNRNDHTDVYCGSCHGVPPLDGTHDPTATVFDCFGCHSASVDDFGGILLPGAHLNGVVDVTR